MKTLIVQMNSSSIIQSIIPEELSNFHQRKAFVESLRKIVSLININETYKEEAYLQTLFEKLILPYEKVLASLSFNSLCLNQRKAVELLKETAANNKGESSYTSDNVEQGRCSWLGASILIPAYSRGVKKDFYPLQIDVDLIDKDSLGLLIEKYAAEGGLVIFLNIKLILEVINEKLKIYNENLNFHGKIIFIIYIPLFNFFIKLLSIYFN